MSLQSGVQSANEPHLSVSTARQVWTSRQRQEWTERYRVAGHEHPALTLGEGGLIGDCNKPLQLLFGLRRVDLVWQQVSKLFPQLEGIELVQAGIVNPRLNYLCRCGQLFHAQTRRGDIFSSNLSIVRLEYAGRRSFRMIVRPE